MPVLDGELHRDPQPLPVTRGLGNVITDLLGRLRRKHRLPSAKPSLGSQHKTPTPQETPSPPEVLLLCCKIAKKSFFSASHMARAPTATGAAQDLLQPGPPPPTRQHPTRPSPPQPSEASGQPRSHPRFRPPPARCRGTYQTERADLGGQSGGGADLPAGAAQIHCGHSTARQPRCNGPGRSPPPSRPRPGLSPPRSHRHPRGPIPPASSPLPPPSQPGPGRSAPRSCRHPGTHRL